MLMLRYLASIFIDTFGITRPSPAGRDRAVWYITVLVVILALIVFGFVTIVIRGVHA